VDFQISVYTTFTRVSTTIIKFILQLNQFSVKFKITI